MLTENEARELIAAAAEARHAAYAPYSGFKVGAALRSIDGEIFTGCNVENASFGLTICAERNAVAHAIAQGVHQFNAIAVVTENGVTPCGACRQVLAEFSPDIEVIIATAGGQQCRTSLHELLPAAFVPAQLHKDQE